MCGEKTELCHEIYPNSNGRETTKLSEITAQKMKRR